MELKILYLAVFFLLWTILIKYVPLKYTWLPSVLVLPAAIAGAIIYVFVTRKNFSAIVLIIALIAGAYIYFKWVKKKKKEEVFAEIDDWVKTINVAVLLALVIMTFIIQAFKIPSGSMRNTFLEGDHLFVGKFVYGVRVPIINKIILPLSKPTRQDIIVFRFPLDTSKDYIKRCIGIPGDVLEMKEKKLYVNGELQKEPYVVFNDPAIYSNSKDVIEQYRIRDNFGPITVSSGCYFMMGDNRDRSYDSRFWGKLEEKYIKGMALFIYWPLNRIGIVK